MTMTPILTMGLLFPLSKDWPLELIALKQFSCGLHFHPAHNKLGSFVQQRLKQQDGGDDSG